MTSLPPYYLGNPFALQSGLPSSWMKLERGCCRSGAEVYGWFGLVLRWQEVRDHDVGGTHM